MWSTYPWATLFVLAAGCIATSPATVDDVIPSLTITAAAGYDAIADGVSRATVTITTVDDGGRDPALSATLKLTTGAWVSPDPSDTKTATVALKGKTEARDLVVPRQPGEITVTALVAGFTRTASLTLEDAPVTRLDCGITGALPTAMSAATVTLSAALETKAPGSRPSIGTAVDFTANVSPGTAGYPAVQRVFVADASTVQVAFTALPGATRLEFKAAAGSQECSLTIGN
jgi:hypothetical protein